MKKQMIDLGCSFDWHRVSKLFACFADDLQTASDFYIFWCYLLLVTK